MQFTEFLRKNIVIIATLGITLIGTVVLIMLLLGANESLQENRQNVDGLKQDELRVQSAKWALTQVNLDIAEKNAELAREEFNQLLKEVSDTYETPQTWDTNPVGLKNRISTKCNAFERRLQAAGVQTTITSFTFESYTAPGYIPKDEELPRLQENLGIVEELVSLVSSADVQSLTRLTRPNGQLAMQERDRYRFIRYELEVTGDIRQVRNFLNLLKSSRMLFIIQKVNLTAKDDLTSRLAYPAARTMIDGINERPDQMPDPDELGPLPDPTMRPGGRGTRPQDPRGLRTPRAAGGPGGMPNEDTAPVVETRPLTLAERVIFRELTTLNLVVTLDYVEFKSPDEEED